MVLPEVAFVGTLTFVGFNFLRALSQKPISKVHNGRREKERVNRGKGKKFQLLVLLDVLDTPTNILLVGIYFDV